MVDARRNTMTPGVSWFRPMRSYVQQRSVHCITCTEVLVVGVQAEARERERVKLLDLLVY